jgi:hypothetical protein
MQKDVMKRGILLGLFALVFLFGCTQSGSSGEGSTVGHLCPDGTTIVSDLSDCPKIDAELKECEDASAVSSYGASDRDVCYYDLALLRENITLCRKIRNTDSWYDYTAAKCGADLAIYSGNVSLCDELSLTSKYDCYEELAGELEDPTICEYITSDSKMDDCLYNYVSYNYYYISDWSICDSFSGKGYEANYCYSQAAEYTGDESYCDKITKSSGGYYSYSKASCYAGVAKGDGSPALCGTLATDGERDDCYYDYATAYPYDVDACGKISDSYRKNSCISYANYSYSYY